MLAAMARVEELQAIWLDLRAHVEQLAGERQQYLVIFEQASDAYVVTERDGTIQDANGPAVDILQRRRRDLRGKPIAALVALDRRAEFRRRLRALIARESQAERTFRTIFEAPELRTEVTLTARLIERPEGIGGICWRLDPAP
jgi:PAS domain S-box-containing protein